MAPARSGATAVVAVVAVTGVLLVLVTWAASIGPQHLLGSPGVRIHALSTHQASVGPQPRQRGANKPAHVAAWTKVIAEVFEVLTVILTVLLLWWLVRWVAGVALGRPRRVRRGREPVDFEPLDPPVALAEAVEQGADEQRALLDSGSPRNAIVACWHRFEVSAERARLAPEPWETPAEFVLRVLDVAGADPQPVIRLAALYREARFSDHPLTEDHRRRAIEALEATYRSLKRRPVGAAGAGPS